VNTESQGPEVSQEEMPASEATAQPGADETNARVAYTPGQKALIGVLVLVIVGALVLVGNNVYRTYVAPPPRFGANGPPTTCGAAARIPAPVGDPDAPIRIEVVFGHCIAPAMLPIRDAISAYPARIQGKFYALESAEGQKLIEEHGMGIAAVFIDNENKFTIKDADDAPRNVVFQGPPGQDYTLADLVEVLRMKLVKTEGGVPTDFDLKMAALRSSKADSEKGSLGPCADGSCSSRRSSAPDAGN